MDAQDDPLAHFGSMSRLAVALKVLPAQVLEHHYFGEAFGSWHVVIRHRGRVSQLAYDGRDHHLGLRRSLDRKPPFHFGEVEQLGVDSGLGSLDAATIAHICRAVTS